MTEPKPFNVFGVGNALLDILALVEDNFIQTHDLNRGSMTLMDTIKQGKLLQQLESHPLELRCGGSAANTMMAIAQSGGTGIYSGKVSADTNGEFYQQDMVAAGIQFEIEPADTTQGPTGTCLVLTTPDAERTMCTNLGVSTTLSVTDINVDHLSQCQYSYIEGYLWDAAQPRKASIETMEQSKRLGVKVAFTFSDMFLVERFGDDFRSVLAEYCDVLFCNADEVRHFCGNEDLEVCARQLGEKVNLVFITNSNKGCLVVENQSLIPVPGFPVKPVDTVGAGDAFAGGVLYGLTNGLTTPQAARWGNYLGSQIVQIHGPRLSESQQDKLATIIN
ncbi:adenosine kinase [Planktothrix sp. FACHB-1365]|uniref:adenosine kinase n=1 Tax=Planktothrix sp. FACHB-1365 TaxID=2692855 RepID=UPI001686B54C|nr:adenosine kinase [Planktothrix sp. FACHB-1365]MBD2480716.1 adenosine kinase [Planktothrix sp. FACHB-1365]